VNDVCESDAVVQSRDLISCHECDALHRKVPLARGAKAQCSRCGAFLYKSYLHGLDWPLALALGALGLFLVAHVFPFMSLKIEGRIEENLVASGVGAMWDADMPELAVLVALTSIVFPLLNILGLLWLLLPRRMGFVAPGAVTVAKIMHALGPWSLLAVFMLGVLVAFVKLLDLATVIPGTSMFAFAALMLVATAANASFHPELIWPESEKDKSWPVADIGEDATAEQHGLLVCHLCHALTPADASGVHTRCHRCGSTLHSHRKHNSLTRTWALVISAAILVIPANVYPVMTVIQFGQGQPSTIMSGVLLLIAQGMWGLAMIVFVASVVVPLMKLALLVYLLVSVQRRSAWRPADRTRLYRVTEVVGAWSMVDIFLVSILSAIVNLDALASIEPGIGASFFGAVVVITMFAALSFDPRLIWDHAMVRTSQGRPA
tara:strand:- start:2015 stop:3316 length:1302 start_codon:yes stop_codon:yes gene_type:complete